jgi:hypothetical protein
MNSLIQTKCFPQIAVVCWIKRAKRLGINIPLDDKFEKDLMNELEVKSHEELERNLKFLHDETFVALVESILRRRKKGYNERKRVVEDIYR